MKNLSPRKMFVAIILAILAVTTTNCSIIPSGRIVGGEITPIEKLPYQVEVVYWVHRCGGAVINETTIITAAHCLEDAKLGRLEVRAGTSIRNKGGIVIPVKKFLSHPEYDSNLIDADLAILWLETPLKFNDEIQPIDLPEFNEPVPENTVGIASGWGKLSEKGDIPEMLRSVDIPVVSNEKCQKLVKAPVTNRMLCAGYPEGGKDACQQDSGGPFVAHNKLIGVISWAFGCARKDSPGVYARVASMRDWIDEVRK